MNATAEAVPHEAVIIPLPDQRPVEVKRKKVRNRKEPFRVAEFTNRGGTQSWRVTGTKRSGERIRENFAEQADADDRFLKLMVEYKQTTPSEATLRATKLTVEQENLAHAAILQLGEDWQRLLDCVNHWQRSGAKDQPKESPRIDDALDQYIAWLDVAPFRDATKRAWKIRMNIFKNSVQNVRVAEMTPEIIEKFLGGRKISDCGKDTDRRAISRFFSWAIERPRRWINSNPCREVKTTFKKGPPKILTVADCQKLMSAAENYLGGLCAPMFALGLFGGLRPSEVERLQWSAINLKDREIRLEADQTKNEKARVVEICDTLHAWLKRYEGVDLNPTRYAFDKVRRDAGFRIRSKDETLKTWEDDVLRHTAISHHFRKHQSYGKAAEQFDNSEQIIKDHYQSRVTTEEMRKFYALRPAKGGVK